MRWLIAIMILSVCLTACSTPTGHVVNVTDPLEDPLSRPPPQLMKLNKTVIVPQGELVGTEGELLVLDARIFNASNATVLASAPFLDNLTWQTVIGDEGRYNFTVLLEEGNRTQNATLTVRVLRANRPPVISCTQIFVDEGDALDLRGLCPVTDEDSNDVRVTYAGFLNSSFARVGYEDAGMHELNITASDYRQGIALHSVHKTINITVRDKNRAPYFLVNFKRDILATEGDVVKIPDVAVDPDGDKVKYSYSKFFSNRTWQTKIGDAGIHNVTLTASDGKSSVSTMIVVRIKLKNTAPVIAPIRDITVREGELIELPLNITDREGDAVTITVTGWMNASSYRTNYYDSGRHHVTVTASDGVLNSSREVRITVINVNRPLVQTL